MHNAFPIELAHSYQCQCQSDMTKCHVVSRIKFNRNVLPACLNTGDSGTEYARATGWGALGHRQALADTLQVVSQVDFIPSMSYCAKRCL